jgi:hypothetical protein
MALCRPPTPSILIDRFELLLVSGRLASAPGD